jgi:large subunit ribosomal protein L23
MYQIILGPYTTEKSVRLGEKHHQIAFRVAANASKTEVKTAVERIFSVVVDAVRTVRIKGKHKQFKQVAGRRSDFKKAYVSLAEGYDINIAKFK